MEKGRSRYWMYGIGAFSLLYAVIRYHLFKDVSWEHFPLYILNKAISLASLLLLAASFLTRFLQRVSKSGKCYSGIPFALAALGFAFLHGLISAVLLRPATYPQLFREQQLNFTGEAGLLLGILTFAGILFMGITTLFRKLNAALPIEQTFFRFLKYGSLCLAGGHVFTLGINTWQKPEDWPGYLLPISLIAFLAVALTILFRMLHRNRPEKKHLSINGAKHPTPADTERGMQLQELTDNQEIASVISRK